MKLKTLTALCLTAVAIASPAVAQATPDQRDLALEAAFCHDVRQDPTISGVKIAALEMIRIYGDADKAADVTLDAINYVCPDLRVVVMSAVQSPGWSDSNTNV